MDAIVMTDHTGKQYGFVPGRDIMVLYPRLVLAILDSLARDREIPLPEGGLLPTRLTEEGLQNYLKNVEELDVGKALSAFSKAFILAADPALKDPLSAMKEAGFLDFPRAVQEKVLWRLAPAAFGAFWLGVRSSVIKDQVPADITYLSQRGAELWDGIAKLEQAQQQAPDASPLVND